MTDPPASRKACHAPRWVHLTRPMAYPKWRVPGGGAWEENGRTMQYQQQMGSAGGFAANAAVEDRAAFLVRTYLHLVGAIFAFVFLETFFFMTPLAQIFAELVFFGPLGGMGWLLVLGGFMAVSYVAQWWARSGASPIM